MAITFTKDLPTTKILMAYNNNVLIFKSDTLDKTPLKADIFGFGANNIILYPSPDGSFRFNLLDYVAAFINTNNFNDTINPEIDNSNIQSLIYDVANGCYLSVTLNITISFSDETFETTSKSFKFIAGVEQIEKFKKSEILSASNFNVLSPVADRTNNTHHLKYWEGYPFEFSFYSNYQGIFNIKNTTVNTSVEISTASKVNALYLSDGRADITIEDFLPLITGHNQLLFYIGELLQDQVVNLQKEDSDCGVYLKWLNQYGRWNYWLFKDEHFRNSSSRSGVEVFNDFDDLNETKSPTLTVSKTTQDTMKIVAERLFDEHLPVIHGLRNSIKVMMFTGDRFAQSGADDWVEVNLKTNSFNLKKPMTKVYRMEVEIELPVQYGQKL